MIPQLVIFDCDGVLIDSEMIACRVDAEYLTEIGFPMTVGDVLDRYIGRSAAFMRQDVEQRFGRPLPGDALAAMERRLAAAFDRELRPIAGVAGAIARIAGKTCVASSSTPQRIEHALRATGLFDFFHPRIFSAVQVARGKPAPDLFLFAAERMGASPADCVVIEDSPAGIEAARAANMSVIGFAGGAHCGPRHGERLRAAGASTILTSMDDLPNLLDLPARRRT